MKPGHYIVESRESGERTVIEVTESAGAPIYWIGGDQSDTVEEMEKKWKVIRPLDLESDYRDANCTKCGRMRVENNGICEKCRWDNDGGHFWVQPPDNLPPLPYYISDTTQLKGLERSPRIVTSEAMPKDAIALVSPRYNPATGELDMEATAKASAIITNIGPKKTT